MEHELDQQLILDISAWYIEYHYAVYTIQPYNIISGFIIVMGFFLQ